ncbi:hypothetical protein MNBD_GAMMA08-1944 [hydrothermal vent metagenome]|uniref:Outer membrane protein H n=1 Tax=hydrothermal vent metagenome TaxID=652676 RepID=A0A3B0XCK7_9ZZZZ
MFKKPISLVYVFLFFSLAGLSLTGCDNFQSTSNTVILDLDAIAKATGQADIITQQIEQANNELNSQLTNISNQLNEQLADEKKKIGKKPSKKDQQELQQLSIQANQKMQQAKNIAAQKSQQYKVALVQQLRKKIQPIAESIAREKGADIVTAVNNSTIWFNPEVDITDEIIAEMRAQPVTTNTQKGSVENTESAEK